MLRKSHQSAFNSNIPNASHVDDIRYTGDHITCNPLILRVRSHRFDRFEELDVVDPNLVGVDVHAHLIQREVVRLCHFFSIRGQRSFRLFHVVQIAFPQINVENFDEAALKQLLHLLVLMVTHLALDVEAPKPTGRWEL